MKGLYQVTLALAGLALTTGLAACGGGGGGSTYSDPYANAWFDVYGKVCSTSGPRPGCNFYRNGSKIIDIEDPYFYNSAYVLKYDRWSYYNSYGFFETYTGWAWQSPNGIVYNDFGRALNETNGKGRDYAADVAREEKSMVKTAGEFFSAKYGLDAETGVRVARILKDWAVLGRDRARTEDDIAAFTQRLYGLNLNEVKGALSEAMKGDKSSLEGLVDKAATNWGTSPETMKEILKSWYGNQIDQI